QIDDSHCAATELLLDLVSTQCRFHPRAFGHDRRIFGSTDGSTKNNALRSFLQVHQLGSSVLIALEFGADVFINGHGFVVLQLALEIKSEVVQQIGQCIVQWACAELFESQVEHSLALDRKTEHLV